MIRDPMNDPASFLARCDALTSGRSPAEILSDARAYLSEEEHWCQKARARTDEVVQVMATDDGTNVEQTYVTELRSVSPNDPRAVSFSIEGAVSKASNDLGVSPPSVLRLLDQFVIDFLGFGTEVGVMEDRDVAWFNDNFDHDSVVEFLDYVLERLSCG